MNLETETTSVENATFCLLKTANANKLNASLEDSKALEYQLALIDGCVCLRILSVSEKNLFLHLFTGDFAAWRKKLKKLGKQ
jgi:hypothetical protein